MSIHKRNKLNEGLGIISGISSLASAYSGAKAGYKAAKGTDDIAEAKELLMQELISAFYSFERSLQKIGYSSKQILSMQMAYKDNMNKLITLALTEVGFPIP